MKINKDNLSKVPKDDRFWIKAHLNDLEEINEKSPLKLYIEMQDFHNEYSAERVDPCPDYYGYYLIRVEGTDAIIGEPMTLKELDNTLYIIYSYIINL